MNGVKVNINEKYLGYRPFGNSYEAKGAYTQGNFIVVVGNIKDNTSIRMKYPRECITIEIL